MKKLKIELPKGYMNVAITTDNYIIADTNDSANMDQLKFPLPKGKWSIWSNKDKFVTLKKVKKDKKLKRTILVTHWDKNIDPEILTVKGKSEKELIYEYCVYSDKAWFVLGEDDEYTNNINNGEMSEEELIKSAPFDTLDDFLSHLNSASEYHFRDK